MNYSTLQEAYNIDSFERKKKKRPVIDETIPDAKDDKAATDIVMKQDMNIQTDIEPTENLNIFKKKSELQPYYDEELNQYLNYREFNQGPLNENTPRETSREQLIRLAAVPKIPSDSLSNFQMNTKPSQDNVPVQNTKTTQSTQQHTMYQSEPYVQYVPTYITEKKDLFYKNLVNIGLFVFIGVLIIFLCDQITEIAISIGMKRTVALLEPYLKDRI